MNSLDVFQDVHVANLYDYWAEKNIEYTELAIELELAMREFQFTHNIKEKVGKNKSKGKSKGNTQASFNVDKIKLLSRQKVEAYIELDLAHQAFKRSLSLNSYSSDIKDQMINLSLKVKEIKARSKSLEEEPSLEDVLMQGN